jgi:hypothetical protein
MSATAFYRSWTGRQRLLALLTPIGPLLCLAGTLVAPPAADDFSHKPAQAGAILDVVAADRTSSGLGGALIVVGLLALLPGLALVVSRVTGRGARLATIGGAVTILGVMAGSITNTFYFHSFALTDPAVHASAHSLAVAYAAFGPIVRWFFLLYGVGTVFGFPVLGIAAFRSGLVPRWAAAVLGLTGPGFVLVDGMGVMGGVVTSLMLLIGLWGCGALAIPRSADTPIRPATSATV